MNAELQRRVRMMTEEVHVAPEIIERVIRLNPDIREGQCVRGIHYKKFSSRWWFRGGMPKGRFLKQFGREAWARVPRDAKWKEGRREFINDMALHMRIWERRA